VETGFEPRIRTGTYTFLCDFRIWKCAVRVLAVEASVGNLQISVNLICYTTLSTSIRAVKLCHCKLTNSETFTCPKDLNASSVLT
jgi:hypothetical protein